MVPGADNTNFLHDIFRHAAATPDKPALLTPGVEAVSYGALWDEAQSIARSLARAGLGRADVVAAALPGGAELLRACLGAAGAAAFAPLDPALPQPDLEFLLSDLHASALIVPDDGCSAAAAAARAAGVRVFTAGSLHVRAADVAPPHAGASDPAFLLHTSATTGKPKLVCLSHANFRAMALNSVRALGLTAADRFLSVMPLFHLQGLQSAVQQLMVSGIVVCGAADAQRFPEWLEEFAPTWYTAGPALHRAVLAALRERGSVRRCTLRFVRSIGAPLPPALLSELEDALHAPVLEGYGLTETGPVTSNPLPPRTRKAGSAGISIGPEVGILDGSGRVTAVAGCVGEIVVRGPSVAGGYRNDPEATRAAFHDGWFRTGDLGRFDGDGYLYIAGRIKEMINRGGEKILPGEIDDALAAHAAVAEAAAFGVPHPTLGEDVAAAVVLRAGAAVTASDLRAFARARLAAYKVPRRILFVDAIPKSATGKPRRHALAEQARAATLEQVAGEIATPLEAELAECWARVLDRDTPGVNDDFFALGGDSFSAKLMLTEVQEQFGNLADEGEFLLDPTIATLARLIESWGEPDLKGGACLFALQPRGLRPPFFCIPGAAEDPYYLRRLAARLGVEQPFYILRGARPGDERAAHTVEEAAARFAGEVIGAHPEGPYLVGGHCYGGIVAFELARQLAQDGRQPALLVLFDTPTPGYPKVLRNWRRYLRQALQVTGTEAAAHVRFLAGLCRQRLSNSFRRPCPAGPRASGPVESNEQAGRAYVPKPYPGKVHAFLAGDEPHSTRVLEDSRLGWRDFAAGGFDYRVVSGTHMTMFREPHVQGLAREVAALLRNPRP